ncbi:dual specificity protein phosphatase 3-like [Diadema setosum]|uniref:dual specificity protein phosphatase 3-like n=1 Tax=Diadema setosum TaxID=31175 RepID=UPI003B3A0254
MGNRMTSSTPVCTVHELEEILWANGMSYSRRLNSVDLVYKDIFIGGEFIAKDKARLKQLGITHIINCAQGTGHAFLVDTDQEYYEDVNIKFLGLPVCDTHMANIKQHFETAARFMDDALQKGEGRVLVHCYQGISRSATIVIAYLMLRHGMTAQDATRTVRERRDISPNSGFLQQLCTLHRKLHRK